MKVKIKNELKSEPISLAGCKQVFEKAGIPFEEYKNLTILEIFNKAKRIAIEQNITCDEVICLDVEE